MDHQKARHMSLITVSSALRRPGALLPPLQAHPARVAGAELGRADGGAPEICQASTGSDLGVARWRGATGQHAHDGRTGETLPGAQYPSSRAVEICVGATGGVWR